MAEARADHNLPSELVTALQTVSQHAEMPTEQNRKHLFNAFWEENRHRIRMPRNINYPPNIKEIAEWKKDATSLEIPALTDFVQKVENNLRYYSFDVFEQVLLSCSRELKDTAESRDAAVVLYVPQDYRKSKVWTALLAWPVLHNIVIDIAFDIKEILEIAAKYADLSKPIIWAHIDDVTYTGNQLSSEFAEVLKSEIRFRNGDLWWFLVPFIGSLEKKTRAIFEQYKNRTNLSNIIFPQRALSLGSTLGSEVGTDTIDDMLEKIPVAWPAFAPDWDSRLVYFDHKLATSLSVTDRLFAFAARFQRDPETDKYKAVAGNSSMISRCEPSDYHVNGQLATPNRSGYDPERFDFDSDGVCPLPFYKTIKYHWKGAPIPHKDSNITLSLLLQNEM